jgi:hypothetical protein
MSPRRTLFAGSLWIVVATYGATWGCAEGFSGAPIDVSPSFDGAVGDSMVTEALRDGPMYDAWTDGSVMEAADPDTGDAAGSIDASQHEDAANPGDATVDGKDVLDGGTGASDAADAADAPPPSFLSSTSVSVTATCNGAAGTTPQAPVQVTLTNNGPTTVTWSASAVHGAVVAQPNTGTVGVGGSAFTATSVMAAALTSYPPGPTLYDTLVVTTNDGRAPLLVPVTVAFLGYHADTPPIAFGLVPRGTSVTRQVAVTFNGTCCTSASPDAVLAPFSAVSTRSAGVVTDVAITFSPTEASTFSASFQFAGTPVQVCSPPIMVSGTGN